MQQCIETPDSAGISTSYQPSVPGHQLLSEHELPGIEGSVRMARDLTAKALHLPHIPSSVRESAILVVSELATNAVTHTTSGDPGGTFTVRLLEEPSALTLEVVDAGSTTIPAPRTVDATAEHGRGLSMVAAFTNSWGLLEDARTGVYAHWSWTPGPFQPTWAADWVLTDDDHGSMHAHHLSEDLVLIGANLEALRRPMVSVNRVVELRAKHPTWVLTYDRNVTGPGWFTARRRNALTHSSHGQVDVVYAQTVAGLGELLMSQQVADRRARRARDQLGT